MGWARGLWGWGSDMSLEVIAPQVGEGLADLTQMQPDKELDPATHTKATPGIRGSSCSPFQLLCLPLLCLAPTCQPHAHAPP